jgi:flagellar motor switch/type III secretory pathway protein FliN
LTHLARDWLPLAALDNNQIYEVLQKTVGTWSAKWFAGKPYAMAKPVIRGVKPVAISTKAQWCSFGSLWVDWDDAKAFALSVHVLDAPKVKNDHKGKDAALLKRLADEIISELVLAFELALGINKFSVIDQACPEPFEGSGLDIRLDVAGRGPSLRIGIPAQHAVSFRKSLINSPLELEIQNSFFEDVLGTTEISFSAILGVTEMSATELGNLSEGDVIVLNQAFTDPIALRTKQHGISFIQALVSQNEKTLQLSVVTA